MTVKQLIEKRIEVVGRMRSILSAADSQARPLTGAEEASWNRLNGETVMLGKQIQKFAGEKTMRVLSPEGKLNQLRGELLEKMKGLVRAAEAVNGVGSDLSVQQEREWGRLHYQFQSKEPPADTPDKKRSFLEKWDAYLGEVENPISSRIYGGTSVAGGRSIDYGGRVFEDENHNTIRALGPTESFTSWGRNRGLINPDAEPQMSLGEFIHKIVAGSPDDTQSIGTPGLGGYLVPSNLSLRLLDLALNQTRVKEAGATVVPMTTNTLTIAKVLTPIDANWTPENSLIEESGLTFGPVVLTSHKLAARVRCSIELIEDSVSGGGIQSVVERYLAAALAQEVDRAALFGSGSGAEPKGVWNYDGIQTLDMDGQALDSYEALSMAVQKLTERNITAGDFILAPRTDGEIDRLVDQLGRPLEMPRSVASRRFLPTNQVPVNLPTSFGSPNSGTNGSAVFVADWPSLLLGMRTSLTLEASRVAAGAFEYGQVVIRAYLRADVALAREQYFVAIRGIVPPSNESPA